jgi:hypothetical protein
MSYQEGYLVASKTNRKNRRAILRAFQPIKVMLLMMDIHWSYHVSMPGAFKERKSKPSHEFHGVRVHMVGDNPNGTVTGRTRSGGPRTRVYIDWQRHITEEQMRMVISDLIELDIEREQIMVLR